MILTENKLN